MSLNGLPVLLPKDTHRLFSRVNTDGGTELTLAHANLREEGVEVGDPLACKLGVVGIDDRGVHGIVRGGKFFTEGCGHVMKGLLHGPLLTDSHNFSLLVKGQKGFDIEEIANHGRTITQTTRSC